MAHVSVVLAAQSIANIVKSSLGPLGLDKMLVDNIGVRKAGIQIVCHILTCESCRKSQFPTMGQLFSPYWLLRIPLDAFSSI